MVAKKVLGLTIAVICAGLLTGCFPLGATKATAMQFDEKPLNVLTLRSHANKVPGPVQGWIWFDTNAAVYLQTQHLSGPRTGPAQKFDTRAISEIGGDGANDYFCAHYVTGEHDCFGGAAQGAYAARFLACTAPNNCRDIDALYIEAGELAQPSGKLDPQELSRLSATVPQLVKRLTMGQKAGDAWIRIYPATENERRAFFEQLAQYPDAAKVPRARFLEAEEKRRQEVAVQQKRMAEERKRAAEEREKELRKQRLVRQQRAEQIAKWRTALRVGTQTFCGRVIEVRAPMVKIAVRSDVLQPGLPSEQWLEVNEVYPPTFGCRHAGGQLSAIEE